MKVLICGGGVAGLTLAYWIERFGSTPVVLERSPHGRLGGYGFDFAGTAYDVSAQMGLIEQLQQRQLPVERVAWVDERGLPFARLECSLIEKVANGPYLGLMHYTLEEALIEAVQDRVEIRYEQSIESVQQDTGAVGVTLSDGSTESFDLLVGADGVHSRTRELTFGPERQFARYLGYHMACYPIPDEYAWGPERVHYSEPGRQLVLYPTDNPGELIGLLLLASPDRGQVPRAQRLERLRQAFGGMGWHADRVLANAPASEDSFMDTMTQIVMPRWWRGRVGLIGDACGALTLLSGQGVSMAMGGAYVLASRLRDSPSPEVAFQRYQSRLAPEVERRQRAARGFARALLPSSHLGLLAQRQLTRLLLRESFAGLLRKQIDLRSILSPADFSATPVADHGTG